MLVLVRASVFAAREETDTRISILCARREEEGDSLNNSSLTSSQPTQIDDISFPLREVRLALPDGNRDPKRAWSSRRSSRDYDRRGESEEESGSEHDL